MKKMKFPLIASLIAGLFTIVFIGCKKDLKNPSVTSDAKGGVPSIQYEVPTLACAGSTLTSIDLLVTAGPLYGAPSGFSIQWMTAADFQQYGGWPVGDPSDLLTSSAPSFCKGSFSGNAYSSRYNLAPGGSVTVTIGSFLFDNGASTNCPQDLVPCTDYVFRIFAHGDSKRNRSNFSANTTCTTECDNTCGRHGYGYWKNHCELIPADGLTLGTVSYTADQICTILNTAPPVGTGKKSTADALYILAHQLISAKLNGDDTTVADAAMGSQNVFTDYQPASWQAGLIGSLRHHNESCTQ